MKFANPHLRFDPPSSYTSIPTPRVLAIADELSDRFSRTPLRVLIAMKRVAKTRLRPFFTDPRVVEALDELIRRRSPRKRNRK